MRTFLQVSRVLAGACVHERVLSVYACANTTDAQLHARFRERAPKARTGTRGPRALKITQLKVFTAFDHVPGAEVVHKCGFCVVRSLRARGWMARQPHPKPHEEGVAQADEGLTILDTKG